MVRKVFASRLLNLLSFLECFSCFRPCYWFSPRLSCLPVPDKYRPNENYPVSRTFPSVSVSCYRAVAATPNSPSQRVRLSSLSRLNPTSCFLSVASLLSCCENVKTFPPQASLSLKRLFIFQIIVPSWTGLGLAPE